MTDTAREIFNRLTKLYNMCDVKSDCLHRLVVFSIVYAIGIDEYIEPLTHLINESLRTGICPSELKLARVVPIFKSGDPSLLTNFRPISILSFFSKVFERIVYDYLFDFICTKSILYDYQFGFSLIW